MTPRQRLYEKVSAYTLRLRTLRTRQMLWYSAKSIDSTPFYLKDLYQRTLAAEQLGYEVILRADDEGLQKKDAGGADGATVVEVEKLKSNIEEI